MDPGIGKEDDLLVAVLSKDVLLFCPASDAEARATLETLAERTTPKLERLLSKERFRYSLQNKGWTVEG